MPTPLPSVADKVMAIRILGTQSDAGSKTTPAGNTFYYRRSVVAAVLNKANVKLAFATQVITPLLAAANSSYAPNQIGLRLITDATDQEVFIAMAGTGAVLTDSAPSLDAVVMRMLTGIRGKVANGFRRMGGLNESDTTRNILTGAGLTAWQAVATALKGSFNDADGNTWVPFHFSRFQSISKTNPTTIRGADITDCKCRAVVGSQRKRKPRIIL